MKTDLKRELTAYTARAGRFDVVTVPPLKYLMIDGRGDPNTSAEYAAAIATLFPVAYTLKFFSKRELDRDYAVMPLEALWWADVMASFTTTRDKSAWHWTALNLVPAWLTPDHVNAAIATVRSKGGAAALEALRFETLDEGLCVQTLHIGSYDDEAPVLARMHDDVLPSHGFVMTGRHHEIYLNDARRTAPGKLRTILRQPVLASDQSNRTNAFSD